MLENLALSVIANFLTDFIKKLLRISSIETPQPLGSVRLPQDPLPASDIVERRRRNQDHRDAALATLAIFFNLVALLGAATLLPLMLKTMESPGTLLLSATRLDIQLEVSPWGMAAALVILFALPSLYAVQWITERVVVYVHNEWSDVDRWRAVRIFIGCCFLWLPLYSGLLAFLLFPQLTLIQAVGYPYALVAVLFTFALPRR